MLTAQHCNVTSGGLTAPKFNGIFSSYRPVRFLKMADVSGTISVPITRTLKPSNMADNPRSYHYQHYQFLLRYSH
jgi:hypothetical protein